jgi:Flp pilus assembly protein TadG
MQSRRTKHGRRRGNAAVELAITVPIMATIIFGSVEVCSVMHTKQALISAAYECAGVAINASGTDANVQARMTQILTERGIVGGSVTTTPASIENIRRGTQITVRVSAPAVGNSLVSLPAYGPANIEATCVMLKEL